MWQAAVSLILLISMQETYTCEDFTSWDEYTQATFAVAMILDKAQGGPTFELCVKDHKNDIRDFVLSTCTDSSTPEPLDVVLDGAFHRAEISCTTTPDEAWNGGWEPVELPPDAFEPKGFKEQLKSN